MGLSKDVLNAIEGAAAIQAEYESLQSQSNLDETRMRRLWLSDKYRHNFEHILVEQKNHPMVEPIITYFKNNNISLD